MTPMNGVLARYLRRRVGLQILGLVLVLTALMQVLELLDVTTEVLDRDLGFAGLARYALLRIPSEIVVALPLAVLLGAMSAFYALARHQEAVAMRCAGLSHTRMFWLLLPLPLLLSAVQFVVADRAVPRAEAALKTWWDRSAPEEKRADPRWVQTRDGPAAFDRASFDGRTLHGLRLYRRGGDGQLQLRLTAAQAHWDGEGWTLDAVHRLYVDAQHVTRDARAHDHWRTNLRPDDVVRLGLAQPHLSSIMLVDVIRGERVGAQPLSFYQTVLYRSFTAPLSAFIMLLLAVPTARALTRGGGGGSLLVALGLGLAYLLCDGIMAALGTSGRLPAMLAVAVAPLAFTAIGLLLLHRADRA